MLRRARLDFPRNHRPIDFEIPCDEPQVRTSFRNAGTSSRLAVGQVDEAFHTILDRAAGGRVLSNLDSRSLLGEALQKLLSLFSG